MESVVLDAVTSPGAATVSVRGFRILELEIYGTATSATVEFYGAGQSGNHLPRQAVRMSDFMTGTSGGINEAWQIDVSTLTTVQVKLTAVTGGNVTVSGRLV